MPKPSWAPALSFKQPPPLSIGLAPGHRLDLPPVSPLARAVGCVAALAHHSFDAPLLGYAQQRQPVFKGFGWRDGRAAETTACATWYRKRASRGGTRRPRATGGAWRSGRRRQRPAARNQRGLSSVVPRRQPSAWSGARARLIVDADRIGGQRVLARGESCRQAMAADSRM